MRTLFYTCIITVSIALSGCVASSPVKTIPLQTGPIDAPVEFGGTLTSDMHLGGFLRLTRDLRIPAGRTLIIDAGSHVQVLGNDSTKIDPEYLDKGTEILVSGRLELNGTQDEPIRFSLDPTTPQGENWAGVELVEGSSARMTHVDLIGAETGLMVIGSEAELKQVNILGARVGMIVQNESQVSFENGQIRGGGSGLLCFDSAGLNLAGVDILDNEEEGLYISGSCRGQFSGLRIERNDIGLVASEAVAKSIPDAAHSNRLDLKTISGGMR